MRFRTPQSTALAVLLAATGVYVTATPAHATGYVRCPPPAKPVFHTSGSDWIEYYGTGKCDSDGTMNSWRVKIGLAEEKVNWGPIPNDWVVVSGSYSYYSSWAADGATRYREGDMWCSDLKDDWEFKAAFRYHIHWTDDHQTYHPNMSEAIRAC